MGIYASAGVSGAHLNPAVTLAFAAFRGFPWRKVPAYVLAQTAGAFAGAAVTFVTYREAFDHFDGGVRQVAGDKATAGIFATYPQPFLSAVPGGFVDQVVGTALLLLVIFALGDRRNAGPASGGPVLVGALVVLIGMTFGFNAGYAINPARDLGPRVFTAIAGWGSEVFRAGGGWWWVPLVAPCLGGLLGGLRLRPADHAPPPARERLTPCWACSLLLGRGVARAGGEPADGPLGERGLGRRRGRSCRPTSGPRPMLRGRRSARRSRPRSAARASRGAAGCTRRGSPGPQKREGDGKSPAGVFDLRLVDGLREGGARRHPAAVPGGDRDAALRRRPALALTTTSSSTRRRRGRTGRRPRTCGGRTISTASSSGWATTTRRSCPAAGSCIFLHLRSGPDATTSGCTAFEPEPMERLLRWLDPAARPVLVQLPEAEYRARAAEWGLPEPRPRARDLGLAPGVFPPGPLNAITDVAGVRVGQVTLVEGDAVRTGVTAVLPHGGNLFQEKVPGAVFVGNAFGKLAGSTQVRELGHDRDADRPHQHARGRDRGRRRRRLDARAARQRGACAR